MVGEVLADDFRAAEVREAQADDLERIRDPALLFLFVRRVEVVAGRDLVVEQREVLVQRFFVELLLVERPAELVERELVVLGARAHVDDRGIGALRIAIFLPGEEVLGSPELHLVEVRERGCSAISRSITSMASSVRPSSSYARAFW